MKTLPLLIVCALLSLTSNAWAASSKTRLVTDTATATNTVPYINAAPADDGTSATALGVQVGGTEILRATATGSVGIGTTTPRDNVDAGAKTGSLILPTGTTGQRPTSGVAGMLRFNATNSAFEGYNGSAWGTLLSSSNLPANYGVVSAFSSQTISTVGTWTLISPGGTNMQVTITTHGRPVLLLLNANFNAIGGGDWCATNLYRGSTSLGEATSGLQIAVATNASDNVPLTTTWVDVPAAGTYTYSAYAKLGWGTGCQIGEGSRGTQFFAYELP